MKRSLFAAALAALTLASAGAASAQDFRRGDDGWRRHAEITVRMSNGRTITAERGDRMFYRLLDRPFNFRPGMTYAYSDRCNRQGCVVFVYDARSRRPVDRIFAPHLQDRRYAWREQAGFDRSYNRFGRYDRDDRTWNNNDDRQYRDGRDGRDDQNWNRDDNRGGDRSGQRDSQGRDGQRDSRRDDDGSGLRGGPM